MDSLLVFLFSKSFALEFYPHVGFVSGGNAAIAMWYSNQVQFYSYITHFKAFTITLGYLIVMSLCIPMGVINLDENIKFQWVSFIGLVVLMAQFTCFFLFESPFYFDQVPAFGHEYKQVASVFVSIPFPCSNNERRLKSLLILRAWKTHDLIKRCYCLHIFSWAFIMLVPSWANEKKDHVSVNFTIWISAIASNFVRLSDDFSHLFRDISRLDCWAHFPFNICNRMIF